MGIFNFTAWPEMLAWPYLILNGWLPYRDIAIAHTPLLLAVLTVFYKLFGVGILQLKIFTWILIATNTTLLFWIAKKFYSQKIAIFTSIVYFSAVIIYEGNGLWFDLALVPFSLLLFYFIRSKKYFFSGIIFILGMLTKQTFIYFSIPIFAFFIKEKVKIKNIERFAFGFLISLVVFIIFLFAFGLLDDFYNWAINFGIFYLPNVAGQISFPDFKQFMFYLFPFAVSLFNVSLLPWVIAGFAGVYPRWELFHFQPALPFLALSISLFFTSKITKNIKIIAAMVVIIFIFVGFKRQLGNNTRFYESDVQKVVEEIKNRKVKDIYVINYWDNVYALSGTVPATKPLIPYIPWYLDYANNKQLIFDDLQFAVPEALVIKDKNKLDWKELTDFINRYYDCELVENNVELCFKN